LLQSLNGPLVQGLYGEEAVRSETVFECVLSAALHRANGGDATPAPVEKTCRFKNEHKKIPQPVKAEGGGSRLRGGNRALTKEVSANTSSAQGGSEMRKGSSGSIELYALQIQCISFRYRSKELNVILWPAYASAQFFMVYRGFLL
jgi:hypothetical protein